MAKARITLLVPRYSLSHNDSDVTLSVAAVAAHEDGRLAMAHEPLLRKLNRNEIIWMIFEIDRGVNGFAPDRHHLEGPLAEFWYGQPVERDHPMG